MNMSRTASNIMAGRTPGGVPRSGGRTAGTEAAGDRRTGDTAARRAASEYPVVGATALAAQRSEAVRPSGVPGQRGPIEEPQLQVAPPVPVATPRAPFVALVLALVVFGVVGILVLNTKIAENVFRLDDLKRQQTSLDRQQEGLERDLAYRESPGQLAAAARGLGLVPSRTPAFIVLPDGRKLGVPQPGSSAEAGR